MRAHVIAARIVLAIAVILCGAHAVAQSSLVFISNYDAKLSIGKEVGHIRSQAKVLNGSTFPISFQKHRIDITVTQIAESEYRADIAVLERSQSDWYPINTEILSIQGAYAAPLEFRWSAGDIALDLAIAVSEFHRED